MSHFNGTIPAYIFDPATGEPNQELCNLSICPLDFAHFTYIPTLAGNVVYLAIFALLLTPQVFLGIRGKTWGYMVGMVCGLILEIIGYAGRVQMHFNPFPSAPFLTYIVTLTIAPAFLSAAIYLCLGRIVVIFSEEASRLKPRTYTIIFVTCDFISLVLQAAGGAITSSADDVSSNQVGVNTMIAGLSTQVVSLFLFMVLAGEYAWRVSRRPSQRNPRFQQLRSSKLFNAFLWGLAVATVTIFIRCCFRVAELSQGFNGHLFNDEVVFMVLEGPMVIIACLCLTVLHPALSFQGQWADSNWSLRGRRSSELVVAKTHSLGPRPSGRLPLRSLVCDLKSAAGAPGASRGGSMVDDHDRLLPLRPTTTLRVSRFLIPAFELYPNTSRQNKPLLIYHSCLPDHATSSSIEAHLRQVGIVEPQWRYTMYPMSHFHSTTHEVLCVVSGTALVCFGGDENNGRVEPRLQKGDVVIIPAGVAHRLVSSEDVGGPERFEMVGSYPVGKKWDLCYGRKGEEEKVQEIKDLGWFDADPLYGENGPVMRF
ncbi:hypothetical protein FH972_021390 [Carpinus fangiana]|uniref:Cupin type-1 domain-containing protein n=1 Tax=Carpinus fangiana TaxID=176857 RepID=A0A5N6KPK7_9ROSI|nr:hypothetical protein FH972_021390 [Carpinus fangiana]